MARAQKQKEARKATAAFPASQPLFSALNAACGSQIGDQKAHLHISRELVQNLDVSNHKPPLLVDQLKSERFVDEIVKAWRAASETYTQLFTELVAVTTPNPDKDEAAMRGHEDFKAILEIVKAGRLLGAQYTLAEEERSGHKAPLPRDWDDEIGVDDDSSEASSRSDDEVFHSFIKDEGDAAKTTLPNRKRPLTELETTSYKPEAVSKRPRKLDQENRSALQNGDTESTESEPVVQYEDISAEVEARLKAKEQDKAAKKARKEDKKRKRESDGSNLVLDESLPLESTPVKKPKKKKSKKAGSDEAESSREQEAALRTEGVKEDDTAGGQAKAAAKQAKRKKSTELINDADGAETKQSKKRKKSKD